MSIPSNPILDIIISLVLIYALFSVLVSVINEFLSYWGKHRSEMLNYSILKLLKDDYNLNYGELFFNHVNIQAITKLKPRRHWLGLLENTKASPKKILPSYISSASFADTLIDIIANQASHIQQVQPITDDNGNLVLDANGNKTYTASGGAPPTDLMQKYLRGIETMKPSPFRDLLKGFYDKADGKYGNLKPLLETWFNEYQDRVSGWYKIKQRKRTMWIGLLVAFMLNVDSLHLVKVLSLDGQLRSKLVSTAERVADKYKLLNDTAKQNTTDLIALFKQKDDTVKKVIDSISAGSAQIATENPKTFLDVLVKKDSLKYKRFVKMVLRNDSVSKQLLQQADEALGIAADLNIPIGYNKTTAPLSWFCDNKLTKIQAVVVADNKGLMEYNAKRNKGGLGVWLRWAIGIIISGISLGVGAPFWFSVLVKLVDIRKAGIKPQIKKEK